MREVGRQRYCNNFGFLEAHEYAYLYVESVAIFNDRDLLKFSTQVFGLFNESLIPGVKDGAVETSWITTKKMAGRKLVMDRLTITFLKQAVVRLLDR